MEITTSFELLSATARTLLRRCGAKKGSRVTVQLCEEVATIRKSYRIDAVACGPDPMQWDSSWTGSDSESNPETSIAVWREVIALKYAKLSARSLAHYKVAIGLRGEKFQMIYAKFIQAPATFWQDPVNVAQALDVVGEEVG